MDNWRTWVGILAGILSLLAFVPYINAIRRRQIRPNRASWWIWSVVILILLASSYSSGAVETLWVPVGLTLGNLVVVFLSFRYGQGGWNRLDRVCLGGAGLSLLLWWFFQAPWVALMLNIAIDCLGALPTIWKAHVEPESEDFLSWTLFLSAYTLNLLALDNWAFSLSVYPLYLFGLAATIVVLLLRGRGQRLAQQASVRRDRHLSPQRSASLKR